MKKEHELILKGVLINKSEIEVKQIDEILNGKISWAEVGGVLINHRLGGYFYKGLTKVQRERLPKEMLIVLKMIVRAQKKKQLKLIAEIKRINDELMTTDIHYAALKGAFFSCDMYEIGSRRSNDIDLLVYEEDLDALDISMKKLGYIQSNMPNGELVEATKKEKMIQRMNYHDLVPYVKAFDDGYLEIDINFLFDNKDNIIDKDVYDLGTQLYKGRNYDIIALNVYTNLAHLCAHFYREATNTIWTEGKRDVTLYKIVDIINYIRYYGREIDINKFIKVIEKLNLKDKVFYTFNIMKEFYDLTFIDEVNALIKSDKYNDDFMNKIYDHRSKDVIMRNESFYETAFSCID